MCPKFALCCMLQMQSFLKVNVKFSSPIGNLPSFIKVSFYCCRLNTNLSFYSQRLLSAAHSQQFRSCHHFRYCNLHLGNFYKNRSGHRTVTSLIFMFPPVMINIVAPLTMYILFDLSSLIFRPQRNQLWPIP